MAELREKKEWNLIFVAMAAPEEAAEFRAKMESPHRFLCDPEAKLYDAFGLKRGGVKQMFNAHSFKRGFEAVRKGHGVGAPVGDPWRLGGTFVLDMTGRVRWEHRNEDAGDNAQLDELERALVRAGTPMGD